MSVDDDFVEQVVQPDNPGEPNETPVENKAQLVEHLESGCKSRESFSLGTEQEQFVFRASDLSPATYDDGVPGIRALLEGMSRFGWQLIEERGFPIAASRDRCMITLEPGGQFELSGAAHRDAHQTYQETRAFHKDLKTIGDELGLRFLALGHQPKHAIKDLPWMPKDRYRIMRDYMPKQGKLGLNMMQGTCSIQVTADFADETDMVKKFRVALALQPLVTALFANSPFVEGKFSGHLCYRSIVWRDTDPDRCGALPFVFRPEMGFESYTDFVLDVPMYFIRREGEFIDTAGMSFRDFLAGQLPILPGQLPTLSDWENHLSTVFPQVRLKKFLEMRGADAGPGSRVAALPALWAGLLYDTQSLDKAWDRIQTWTAEERNSLELGVATQGFQAMFQGQRVRELALWMLRLAHHGLERRGFRNQSGETESCYLEPLQKAAQSGKTFSEDLLDRFNNQWGKDMEVALSAMCEEAFE